MKFSESWLREWVNPEISTDELSHQLTMAGLEVDAIDPVAPAFTGVVVGEVIAVDPHPDADRLRVCQVNVGADENLTIVCGAPNVQVGMLVPTATVGGVLPGDFKIKKAKLRGVESFGMLCSEKEIGLAEQADGLMPLPADLKPGTDIRDALSLNDVAIELGVTPNRGDCLGMVGIAREVGVLNRLAVSAPDISAAEVSSDRSFDVDLQSPEDCGRYVGRVIEGVNSSASTPLWMQERLRRSGLRSLGPVVDVTNYVLLELGQPMHAFDLDKLSGGIVVRRAADKEKLTLLDGQSIELDNASLVIADKDKALALAGIMGGADSAVSDTTTTLFLESAWFNPLAISGRARSYGLHTDSSHRFERGVSPQLQAQALERATQLLLDIVGGQAGPITECVSDAHLPENNTVVLRAKRLALMLGMAVPDDQVSEILERLGMDVTRTDEGWEIVAPAYRFDIAIEADLVEEIGRIVGYDNLPTAQAQINVTLRPQPDGLVSVDRMADMLVDRGYQEAITYSFVDPEMQQLLDPEAESVTLTNPISADLSQMRTSLWPGLVGALIHNLNRQQDRVRLFEYGMTFIPQADDIKQERVMSGVVSGAVQPEQWGAAQRQPDFYDIKGDLEAVLALGGNADDYQFVAAKHPSLHPGQCAQILRNDKAVGWLGLMSPKLEKALDLKGPVFLFELSVGDIVDGRVPSFEALSRFPAIRRDLAIVVDQSVSADAVLACIKTAAPEALKETRVFDVYTGKGVEPGLKSIALGLILQESSRTLTDKEVEEITDSVVAALKKQCGATLRE